MRSDCSAEDHAFQGLKTLKSLCLSRFFAASRMRNRASEEFLWKKEACEGSRRFSQRVSREKLALGPMRAALYEK